MAFRTLRDVPCCRPSCMADDSARSVRKTALFCLACLSLAVAVGIFENGGVRAVAVMLLPGLIAAIPLLFVVWRMSRGLDLPGLATGAVYPALVFVVLLVEARAMAHGSSEEQMDLFARIFFFFASPSWAVCVIALLPGMGALMVRALVGLRERDRAPHPVPFVAVIAILIVGYALLWRPAIGQPLDLPILSKRPTGVAEELLRKVGVHEKPQTTVASDAAEYPQELLEVAAELHKCMLIAGGETEPPRFPATIEATSFRSERLPNAAVHCHTMFFETRYRVQYAAGALAADGRADSFRLRVTDPGHAATPARAVTVDEQGLIRAAAPAAPRATASTP